MGNSINKMKIKNTLIIKKKKKIKKRADRYKDIYPHGPESLNRKQS